MKRKPLNAPTRPFRTGEVIFREGDTPLRTGGVRPTTC
jgi:hypothetical protein